MPRLYHYVGPKEICRRVDDAPSGVRIESVNDLREWVRSTQQQPNREGVVAVTFVIDEQGRLLVADRGSEHVACSGGRPVLSAGEMLFLLPGTDAEVVEVTNQSTGFCPEPESWPVVAEALDRIGVVHPGRFTSDIVFRLCPHCGQRNIVKDGWFECQICQARLPLTWNFCGEAHE